MAVNDEIFKNLAQYGGGTINERVYNFLGSLGYTGTISDRLGQFEEGGRKGWQGLIRAWGQWSPAQLFSQGQEGVWYEPKPEYLYQDAAGTVPVTADGDPVGLMLDRSRGLSSSRMRVNLIQDSESFDTSSWSKNAATITPDTDMAPDGTISADTIEISISVGSIYQSITSVPGVSYTLSVYIKGDTSAPSDARMAFYDNTNGVFVRSSVVPEAGESAGDFTRYYASVTAPDGCERLRCYPVREIVGTGNSVVLWGAQVEIGSSITEYQPANPYWHSSTPGNHATQSTSAARPIYRTDGVLHWLDYDRVDDNLTFSEILFPGEILICGAVRNNTTSAAMFFGSSVISGSEEKIGTNSGQAFARNVSGASSLQAGTVGTGTDHLITSTRNASDLNSLRVDGNPVLTSTITGQGSFTQTAGSTTSTGTGQAWGGRVYGIIAVGSDDAVERAEEYIASLAGITL